MPEKLKWILGIAIGIVATIGIYCFVGVHLLHLSIIYFMYKAKTEIRDAFS